MQRRGSSTPSDGRNIRGVSEGVRISRAAGGVNAAPPTEVTITALSRKRRHALEAAFTFVAELNRSVALVIAALQRTPLA
jgi:hypothetical protein